MYFRGCVLCPEVPKCEALLCEFRHREKKHPSPYEMCQIAEKERREREELERLEREELERPAREARERREREELETREREARERRDHEERERCAPDPRDQYAREGAQARYNQGGVLSNSRSRDGDNYRQAGTSAPTAAGDLEPLRQRPDDLRREHPGQRSADGLYFVDRTGDRHHSPDGFRREGHQSARDTGGPSNGVDRAGGRPHPSDGYRREGHESTRDAGGPSNREGNGRPFEPGNGLDSDPVASRGRQRDVGHLILSNSGSTPTPSPFTRPGGSSNWQPVSPPAFTAPENTEGRRRLRDAAPLQVSPPTAQASPAQPAEVTPLSLSRNAGPESNHPPGPDLSEARESSADQPLPPPSQLPASGWRTGVVMDAAAYDADSPVAEPPRPAPDMSRVPLDLSPPLSEGRVVDVSGGGSSSLMPPPPPPAPPSSSLLQQQVLSQEDDPVARAKNTPMTSELWNEFGEACKSLGGGDYLAFKILRDTLLSPNIGTSPGDISAVLGVLDSLPVQSSTEDGSFELDNSKIAESVLTGFGAPEVASELPPPQLQALNRVGVQVEIALDPTYHAVSEDMGDADYNNIILSRNGNGLGCIRGQTVGATNNSFSADQVRFLSSKCDEAVTHADSVSMDPTLRDIRRGK